MPDRRICRSYLFILHSAFCILTSAFPPDGLTAACCPIILARFNKRILPMPVDTQQIMDEAEKLGKLVAQHPAVDRFKQAQKSVADDAEASRLLAEFDRQLETLGRAEQSGLGITDAQRQQLESLQSRIISHIKIKNMNLAQVEFVDLLRKVSQTVQGQVANTIGGGAAGGAGGAPAPAAAGGGPRIAR